jgi:phosphoglycolate phosphatase
MSGVVVGFDLDMTLVDSRPGISSCFAALARETGLDVLSDPDLIDRALRRTLDGEFALLFPPGDAARHADRFRELYIEHGVPGTSPLPGSAAAIAAVQDCGGRVIVLTAKYEPNAKRCLDHVGLRADAIIGGRWGDSKATAIRDHGVALYVGDTIADMRAANDAGVIALGVSTGLDSADELRGAGANVVFASLHEFPTWLARHTAPRP